MHRRVPARALASRPEYDREHVRPRRPAAAGSAGAFRAGGLGARVRSALRTRRRPTPGASSRTCWSRPTWGPRAPPTSWRGCGRAMPRATIRSACCARRSSRSSAPIGPLDLGADGLDVILVVGVNGAGKTTTIGKLASDARRRGQAGEPRRERHVPRGSGRAARGVGGPRRAPSSSRRIAAPTRAPSRSTRSRSATARGADVLHRRHRRAAAHEAALDGRAPEGQARDREGGRDGRRDVPRARRADRAERDRAGPRVHGGRRRDRRGPDEDRRVGEGRDRACRPRGARSARSGYVGIGESARRTCARSTPAAFADRLLA